MIRLKTAVLLGCSLKLGAIRGGGSKEDQNNLYKFGESLGISFQIQDDIMDVYADPDKFGKTVGGDIICNKKTLLMLRLQELATPEDKLLLEGDYSGGTHNVVQRDWLPIKGTSRVYNHAFKAKARKDAIDIETLAIPCAGSQDNTYKAMMDMVHAVMVLTSDVSLNPEF